MTRALAFVRDRLLEGSTWAGFAVAFTTAGYINCALACALIAAFLVDRGKADSND